MNDLYEIALRDTPEGVRLHWASKKDRKIWSELREGAYMLRTNLPAGTAEEFWSRYMQSSSSRPARPPYVTFRQNEKLFLRL